MNSLIQTIEILSAEEIKRLIELESIIQSGIKTFISVGKALIEIQDKRLYRDKYSSFEQYAQEQWSISRQTAYQYISAAKVVENLEEVTSVLPTNEAQARELAKLDKHEQQEVWLNVVETAEAKEQPITAKAVREVVKEKVSAIADTPQHKPVPPMPVMGDGLGQGKVHKISAADRIQQEESIAELRQRPTLLEYQILQGELERARQELAAKPSASGRKKDLTYEALENEAKKIYSPATEDKTSLSLRIRNRLIAEGFTVLHHQYKMLFDTYWNAMQTQAKAKKEAIFLCFYRFSNPKIKSSISLDNVKITDLMRLCKRYDDKSFAGYVFSEGKVRIALNVADWDFCFWSVEFEVLKARKLLRLLGASEEDMAHKSFKKYFEENRHLYEMQYLTGEISAYQVYDVFK